MQTHEYKCTKVYYVHQISRVVQCTCLCKLMNISVQRFTMYIRSQGLYNVHVYANSWIQVYKGLLWEQMVAPEVFLYSTRLSTSSFRILKICFILVIYIYKVVISLCLLVCPIITQEPQDRLASNFKLGKSFKNHGKVLSLV